MTRMGSVPVGSVAPSTPKSEEQRLRSAVQALEGVFVEQLFKAMRETVPRDGLTSGGSGEEMFAGMLDQHLAAAVPMQWESGIGESLFRQLRASLPPAPDEAMPEESSRGPNESSGRVGQR